MITEKNIEVPQPTLDGFSFTLTSPDIDLSGKPVTIKTTAPDGSWQLYKNGTLIAGDSVGTPIDCIVSTQYGNLYIKLLNDQNRTDEYVLNIISSSISLINWSSTGRTFNVTEFGDTNSSYYFDVKDSHLTVPPTLPRQVTDTSMMFDGCSTFNQDLSGWDTSNVTRMAAMFRGCSKFNGDISNWNTSNVTEMTSTFEGCSAFNQPLGEWNVSNVSSMKTLFLQCLTFNQDISTWDTGNVENMNAVFYDAKQFNQPIGTWNVGKVNTMETMFNGATLFNQDISGWNVSNVTEMGRMFSRATTFNQDLSQWCVPLITDKPNGFDDGNYDVWVLPQPVWGTCPRHEDGSVPEEPVSQVDLSQITNNNNPGSWVVEVASNEEREAEYDNVIASVLIAINEASKQVVTLKDLVIYTDSSNNTIVTSVTGDDDGKVVGTLVINIKVKPPIVPEEPSNYGPTGLKADYPGTGWYKATDTGTVFNKGVPALETHVFEEGGLEYVSVHTAWDAKTYGKRAAVSNITNMEYLFSGEKTFNDDISTWDVSNVTDMGSMFWDATSFNQDLSEWCVSLIPTKPDFFDLDTPQWTLPKPVWGTCPGS